MHPIGTKCFSGDSFCLSDFILVMWEDEITSTHMNIYLFTMPPHITSTTLNMPSWSSFQCLFSFSSLKGCFPEICTISWIISFPESKVAHIFFFVFIRFGSFPSSCFHTFHIQMGQVSIIFGCLDIKIDRAIF